MYTADAYGPFALIDPDNSPWNVNMTADPNNVTSIFPKSRVATAYGQYGVERFVDGVISFAASEQFTVGVPMSGASLRSGNVAYVYEFTGEITVTGGEIFEVRPFVARADSDTISVLTTASQNSCDRPFFLPTVSMSKTIAVTGAQGTTQASVRERVMLGNFRGVTVSENPVFFGWHVVNPTTGAEVPRVDCSMYVHRYIERVDFFDPLKS